MSDDLREAALHMNEVRLDIIESRKAANEAEQRKTTWSSIWLMT